LRKGMRSQDLAETRYVFVTTNTLLASVARRFLIKEKILRESDCPAVLDVGQLSTIAWLVKDKKFNNEMVGRELLANCYAAMQPQQAWFQTFREAIEKVVGNLETYAQDANNSLILRAARRIAKDESFGSAAIMKTLPIAEIIQRSDQDAQRRIEHIREEERK